MSIEQTFNQLAKQWKKETTFFSSANEMAMHPAYQQIIKLGPEVIPLILKELTKEPDFWFHALRYLTWENPVPKEMEGNIKEMTRIWLAWGTKQGYIK